MKEKFFALLLIFVCLGGLYFSYSKKSSCFNPEFALSPASYPYVTTPPTNEIRQVLNQSFHFLGSGNQSFAFESEDKKSVLKLFKFHCLYGFDLYNLIPRLGVFKEFKDHHQLARSKKADRLITGLITASTYNKAHSGILYLHFPNNSFFDKKVHIQDRAFRNHFLDLNQYVFVLQSKAVLLSDSLKKSFKKGDTKEAVAKMKSMLQMIKEDLNEGIYDNDHNIMANTGFTFENKPLRVDFGKLMLREDVKNPEFIRYEMKKIANERINPWVQHFFPELAPQINNFLNEKDIYD